MFCIEATQNSDWTEIREIGFSVPAMIYNNNMEVFWGLTWDSLNSVYNYWSPEASSWLQYQVDTSGAYYNGWILNGQVNWVNLDYFIDQNPVVAGNFHIQNDFPVQLNTRFYILFPGNTIISLHPETSGKFLAYGLPVGFSGQYFVFAVENGHYYLNQENFTVTDPMTDTLTLEELTQQELENAINNLGQ
jgi:hypothetical protein